MIDKIDSFIASLDHLSTMSTNARKTSLSFTWEKYEENIQEAIMKVLDKNNSQ